MSLFIHISERTLLMYSLKDVCCFTLDIVVLYLLSIKPVSQKVFSFPEVRIWKHSSRVCLFKQHRSAHLCVSSNSIRVGPPATHWYSPNVGTTDWRCVAPARLVCFSQCARLAPSRCQVFFNIGRSGGIASTSNPILGMRGSEELVRNDPAVFTKTTRVS